MDKCLPKGSKKYTKKCASGIGSRGNGSQNLNSIEILVES